MPSDPLNLSGTWDGVFSYPDNALPTTPFLAQISDHAGLLSGTTVEPSIHDDMSEQAVLAGHRAGRTVDFTKIYDQRGEGYDSPVDYVGQLSAEGDVITGSWTMQEWSGTFEMVRQSLLQLEEPVRETTEVEL